MALMEICVYWLTLCTTCYQVMGEVDHIVVRDSLHTQFPIAVTDDFWTLIKSSSMFADKSDFIGEVLSHSDKVLIFTRPPRWGKSINLSMLKHFFDVQPTSSGDRTPLPQQSNYIFFKFGNLVDNSGHVLAKLDLHISYDATLVHQCVGKHPVIYLNCSEVTGDTLPDVFHALKVRVSKIYRQYEFLRRVFMITLNSNTTSAFEKQRTQENLQKFESLLEGKSKNLHLSESLLFLSETLHFFYGMSVVVLIDDYEAPVSHVALTNMTRDNKDTFMKFYDHFLTNSFKSNKYLRKGVLTGVLPLFNLDRFQFSRGVSRYTVTDDSFTRYFGFTSQELGKLFKLMSVQYNLQELAKESYHGYKFGSNANVTMYNPLSIAHFVASNHLSQHVLSAKFIEEHLFSALRVILFREKICGLIYDIEMPVLRTDLQITVQGLMTLFDSNQLPLKSINAKYYTDTILTYMYHYGYLSCSSADETSTNRLSQIWRYAHKPEYVYLRWATKKIGETMRKKVMTFYCSKLHIDERDPPVELIRTFKRFISNRFQSNATSFTTAVENFLHNLTTVVPVKKDIVHYLLNYCALQMDVYDKFADEFNPRKPDMMLFKDDYLVIVEFSIGRDEASIATFKYDKLIRRLHGKVKTVKYVSMTYTSEFKVILRSVYRQV